MVQFLDQDNNPLNIGGASSPVISIGYPDGTRADFNATIYQTGTQGQIYYAVGQNDLPQFGIHRIQGEIITPQGVHASSQVGYLDVRENIAYAAPPSSQNYFIIGNPNLDGSWKIIVEGTNLAFQRREGGIWVDKDAFTP